MNFPFSLLFVSLSFGFVSCEKCSEDLYETFKREFRISGSCRDCEILNPGTSFKGENWGGFCVGGQLFLFRNWKCRTNDELLTPIESVVVANDDVCDLVQWKGDFDVECLQMFNNEICAETKTKPAGVVDIMESKSISKRISIRNAPESDKHLPTKTSTVRSTKPPPTTLNTTNAPPATLNTTDTPPTTLNTTDTPPTTTNTPPATPTTTNTPPETPTTTNTPPETPTTTNTPPETPTTTNTPPETPTTTNTPPETPTTADTTQTTVSSSTVLTTPIKSSTTIKWPSTTKCEKEEYYYWDHCYFVMPFDSIRFQFANLEGTGTSLRILNSSKICQRYHPKALGLAVETEEENEFLTKFSLLIKNYILTSGVRDKGKPDEWSGWNIKVNRSIVNITVLNDSSSSFLFYCFFNRSWFGVDECDMKELLLTQNLSIICERPYNPRNIQPDLHEKCLQLYRNSSGHSSERHRDYCCEVDETGEMWFAFAGTKTKKIYPHRVECIWHCRFDGFFQNDLPECTGKNGCIGVYKGIKYVASVKRRAISNCPAGHYGYSTWYCGWNQTFVGTPDYSLCCEGTKLYCTNIDAFLNHWRGCPSKTIVKKTACPPGSFLNEASVEWYCQENGSFLGNTPDYSNCNITEVACNKTDSFNRTWIAALDTTARKECPPKFTGTCFWKCKKSGLFDGPEPDCSACEAEWMNEVADKIKNQNNHEDVMVVMENYTKTEDLRIGYSQVLKLTAACVGLFKNQTSECQFGVFDKFLKSYSRILKNVAGNHSIWSSFSELNRRNYTEKILHTTQTAAFANLEIGNGAATKYNETFAKFEEDGFDFFVAYNPSVGARFPLQNFTESDWHLDITDIRETNLNFAAMGLVMSYSLTSLMFPKGNATEHLELNSPAITFSVAASRNGEAVVDPNVIISVSFKHINKTRMPENEVIRRRLHPGEQPSGVFNSTLCFYYRDSDWSTEGCSVTYISRDQTNCTCTHLSTIGLLMSVHKYQPNETLEVVSSVSSAITITALILALLVFHAFDTINNDRVLIGINLCLCLLIGHTLLITVIDKKFFNISDSFCSFWAVVLHYTFMAAFAWMFVEGCHLYRMLIVIFDSNIEYRRIYLLIGYGMPLIIVGVTYIFGFILEEQPYGQDEMCWLKSPNFIWAFVGPVIVLTSINFCILVISMRLAISSKKRTGKSSFTSFTLWKGWVSLSALLGITWLFGLAYIHYTEPLVYVFVLLNGLQGLFIFLFRCVLCEQYKTAFLKKIKTWFPKSETMDVKKTQNVKSETKVYLISASKSSETKDSGFDPGTVESDLRNNKKVIGKPKLSEKFEESSSGEDITLTPAVSEAYLRNKMIARNFSVRKSKAKWLEEENFPELSYHDLHPK